MSQVTTHVLDTAVGRPAVGIAVRLEGPAGLVATGRTDRDGRVGELGPEVNAPGDYALVFATGGFYPEIRVAFHISDDSHLHLPLLLSPWSYTTYRGS